MGGQGRRRDIRNGRDLDTLATRYALRNRAFLAPEQLEEDIPNFFLASRLFHARHAGFVWRELKRYGIERDLKYTPDGSHEAKAYAVTLLNGKRYQIPAADLGIFDDA